MDKKALRDAIQLKTEKLPPMLCTQADEKILQNLLALPEYQAAQRICTYVSVLKEVDTYGFMQKAFQDGKRVFVPRCEKAGIMQALEIHCVEDLVLDRFDIPSAPKEGTLILPNELDLILVPAVAFDRKGNRLGRGGGYYDRYLAKIQHHVCTIGVCRDIQRVEELAVCEHDKPVDMVVTETGVFRKIS